MPPHRTFAEGLEFGRRGEKLVECHLQAIGIATMPAYDFGGQGAPEIRRGVWRVAVPDILGMRRGRSFWFEVKTHEAAAFNRKHRCFVHGVRERLWKGYERLGEESGIPVNLLVLELNTCELRVARIGKIETWGCFCSPCATGRPEMCRGKREVYFDRAAMSRVHTFTRVECDAVRGDAQEAA